MARRRTSSTDRAGRWLLELQRCSAWQWQWHNLEHPDGAPFTRDELATVRALIDDEHPLVGPLEEVLAGILIDPPDPFA